jgi:hypothetical protein
MNTNEIAISGYEVVDGRTGLVVGSYKAPMKGAARGRAARLNAEFGGHRYSVRPCFVTRTIPAYVPEGPTPRVYAGR